MRRLNYHWSRVIIGTSRPSTTTALRRPDSGVSPGARILTVVTPGVFPDKAEREMGAEIMGGGA